MNNTRKYFMNALLLSAVTVLLRAVSVSFNAYVTKKIGTEAVGLFTLVMSVYSLAVTLASSSVNLAAVRMTSEELARCETSGITGHMRHRRLRREMGGCIAYSLIFGIAAGILLFALSGFIGNVLLSDGRTVMSLRVLAFSLLPISLSSALAGFFTGLRKVWKNAVVSVSEQLVRISLVSALLVIIAPRGIEYACLAVVGGSAVSEGMSLIMSFVLYITDRREKETGAGHELGNRRKHGKDNAFSANAENAAKPLKKAFSIAFPVASGSYVRQGLLCAEHIAIPRGLAKNGANYSAALSSYGVLHGMVFPLILFPASVIGAASVLLVPELSGSIATGNKRRARAISERAVRLSLWFSFAAAAVFAAFADILGDAVYASGEAGRYVALFAPLVPVMYLDTCVDAMLKGLGEQVYCMKVNILDAFLSLLLVLTLVPQIGVYGYVVCVFLTECVNAALSIGRLISIGYLHFRPSWVLTPLICAGGAASAVRALSGILCLNAVASCALTVSIIAAVFGLISLFGKKDTELLHRA